MNAVTNTPRIGPASHDGQPLPVSLDGDSNSLTLPTEIIISNHPQVFDETAASHPVLAFIKGTLGIKPYDPRWEDAQRRFQNKLVAEQLVEGSWVTILSMGIVTFMSEIGQLTWLMHIGFVIQALTLAFGFAFMPSSPLCAREHSSPKSGVYSATVYFIGIAVGWSCFGYTAMVYLPDQWHGLAVGAIVSVVAIGGFYSSAYPGISISYMIIVASGAALGVWVSDRALGGIYVCAWCLEVLVFYRHFLRRSYDALMHVRDAAELEASEAEKRQAIEFQRQAERKLVKAREEERLRDEARRTHKDETRRQELIELAAQFETTIGEVAGKVDYAARKFTLTAKAMSRRASQAFGQLEQIADAMVQVAEGSTAAAAASDQFAISIDNVTDQAASAAQLARSTNETATTTDAAFALLTQRAENIDEIANLINTIAGRTRLLAVNASIEAARGGNAGRGFAVVATEVKDLASQTSEATRDVSSSIQEIQMRTRNSGIELSAIKSQIGELEGAATTIATAMDQQSNASKSLAQSIDMAASAVGEVSASTQELRKAASAVGTASQDLQSASDELEEQSQLLKVKVASFLDQIRRD